MSCCSGKKSCGPPSANPPTPENEGADLHSKVSVSSIGFILNEKTRWFIRFVVTNGIMQFFNGLDYGRFLVFGFQEFYTKAKLTTDLGSVQPPCASACPLVPHDDGPISKHIQSAMDLVHKDVKNSYFGCGMPYPNAVEGTRVLDLGSGTGRDVFLLAKLAGESGRVTGVDMTPAMLERSVNMIPYHEEQFGFSNVDFKKGVLEELDQVEGLEKGTFDIIISNCVINLTKDKKRVLGHAFNLLKPGGEMCFSDVYTDKPLPEEVVKNELAWNECFSGALPWGEFEEMSKEVGFIQPLVVDSFDYKAYSPQLQEILDKLVFWSKTVRLVKPLETIPDGNKLEYLGTITACDDELKYLHDKVYKKGEVVEETDDNVRRAILSSRFSQHFKLH